MRGVPRDSSTILKQSDVSRLHRSFYRATARRRNPHRCTDQPRRMRGYRRCDGISAHAYARPGVTGNFRWRRCRVGAGRRPRCARPQTVLSRRPPRSTRGPHRCTALGLCPVKTRRCATEQIVEFEQRKLAHRLRSLPLTDQGFALRANAPKLQPQLDVVARHDHRRYGATDH
jgi:hypothetical protein